MEEGRPVQMEGAGANCDHYLRGCHSAYGAVSRLGGGGERGRFLTTGGVGD